MSIYDSKEKINPVRDREGSQRPSISNGVKQFIESEVGKDIFTLIIVVLVGLSSFGLGRLSKDGENKILKIEYQEPQTSSVLGESDIGLGTLGNIPTVNKTKSSQSQINKVKKAEPEIIKNFFASSRGTKYYPIGCKAGQNLKEENRVFFATRAEAENAGYELSSACR